jgi:hypothetical protein
MSFPGPMYRKDHTNITKLLDLLGHNSGQNGFFRTLSGLTTP